MVYSCAEVVLLWSEEIWVNRVVCLRLHLTSNNPHQPFRE